MKDPSYKIHFQTKSHKHRLFPDLIEEELFAIGRVTASFAYLEHALLMDSLSIVVRHRITPLPEKIFGVSFDQRLEAWRKLVRDHRKGRTRDKMLKTAKRIRRLQTDRNRITHGLWNWDYATPDTVTASTFKPKFEFTEPFDVKKLLAVSDALGEINFSLTYQRGKAQAWKSVMRSRAKSGFSVSRDFAMMLSSDPVPPSVQRHFGSAVPPQNFASRAVPRTTRSRVGARPSRS